MSLLKSSGSEGNSVLIAEEAAENRILELLEGTSPFLPYEMFQKYHTESELMRYIKCIECKELVMSHSMISLGSCILKLNAEATLFSLVRTELTDIHSFATENHAGGYLQVIQ